MSKEQDLSGPGRAGPSQPEVPCTPSGVQSVDPGLPASPLTIQNVKKLQGDYTAAKSSLARQSVEAFLQQRNLPGSKSEASRDGRRQPDLPHESEPEAGAGGRLGEETPEKDTEPLEKVPNPDFQARPLASSAPETKKHEFADLATQTEWSYSSTSRGSSVETRRILGQQKQEEDKESTESEVGILTILGAERRGTTERGSLATSSEGSAAESLLASLLEDHHITESCALGYCDFCATALKPFPTPEELDEKPESLESIPCCRTYKDILRSVIEELMAAQGAEGEIDITPHARLSQTILNSKTKSFLMEELQERGIENYKEIFEQYMKLGPCVKVGYKLSEHAPKKPPVRVKKRPQPKEILKIDPEFKPEQAKICHPVNPVKKYYPDGKIFFLLLPDGTGQVYYPSGNIAILITYLKDVQFTYFVLADKPYNRLTAFFTNQGYAACYDPDGNLRVHLDLCHGSSFDERGLQEKCWSWWDATRHVHAPPSQPICIQLNIYIQVKIKAQDQISLTFTKLHHCICLNAGARLKLKDPSLLPILQSLKSQKTPIGPAKALQIKTLLAELRRGLRLVCRAPSGQAVLLDLTALKRLQKKQSSEPKKLSGCPD